MWKDIPTHIGYYQVSDSGQIKRIKSGKSTVVGKILQPGVDRLGYSFVILSMEGIKTQMYIHKLVMQAFVGDCPDGYEVRHMDGNPSNNNLNNLRYGTHSQNMLDKNKHSTGNRGEKHGNAKLTDNDVRNIKLLVAEGNTQRKIAELFSIHPSTVSRIINRRRWGWHGQKGN